jgi:hypothetical protein
VQAHAVAPVSPVLPMLCAAVTLRHPGLELPEALCMDDPDELERGSHRRRGNMERLINKYSDATRSQVRPVLPSRPHARAPSVSRWGDLCTSRPACTIRLVRCAATCLPAIATLVSASQLRASCLGKGPGDLYLLLRAAVKPRCRGFEELVSPRRTQNPNPKFRLSCRGGCVLPCG